MPAPDGRFRGISIPEVPWLKEATTDATGGRPEIRFDPVPHTYEVWDGTVWRKDFPSVTTVTGVSPMPFSAGMWSGMKLACKGIAEIAEAEDVSRFHGMDADALYELLKTTDHRPDRRLKDAGDRGTAIHLAMEAWGETGTPPNPADFNPEDRVLIRGIAKWLGENDPEFFEQEIRTASLAHGYVGTFDAKVKFGAGEFKGKTAIADWKSSSKVDKDKFFPQVEAYREAEREAGFKDVDLALVVHLPVSGRVKAHASTDTFDDFLVLLAHWRSRQARAARNKKVK